MPIHHAVLALLVDGPSHGYELKTEFEAAVGPQWGALNIGHLYQVLDRLTRDGYVSQMRVTQDARPDRLVYEITETGRAELSEWMTAPSPRTAGFRDDFFLKVVAAAQSRDAEVLREVLRTQRMFLLRELRNLEKLRASHNADMVVRLLLSAALRHVSADLAFLDDADESLLANGAAGMARLARSTAPAEEGSAATPEEPPHRKRTA